MCGIWALFGYEANLTSFFNIAMKISHRGPESTRYETIERQKSACLCFHRLAVVDPVFGMQPMRLSEYPYYYLIFNGEIYNWKQLGAEHGFHFTSHCDTEVLIHLYAKGGIKLLTDSLDGVFAFCIFDASKRKIFFGRDTFGVRPIFYLYDGKMLGVCSEMKGLVSLKQEYANDAILEPLKPGHYQEYSIDKEGTTTLLNCTKFHTIGVKPIYKTVDYFMENLSGDILTNIRNLLSSAVAKRMVCDREIGCLLSGGLDSSLITALVNKELKKTDSATKLHTYTIGMEGSTDVAAARLVANHIGSFHHEILFTEDEGLACLEDVVKCIESYDVTTVRASTGMYLVSKWISANAESIVIMSGEGADELCQGYIYFRNSPSAEESDKESLRLLNDIYLYDGLRADRTTANAGLELRVPFLDHRFTSYYLSLPPDVRRGNENDIEKKLLRQAFSEEGLIPDEILWRRKEAFSDGVSSQKRSWYTVIQEHVEDKISDEELAKAGEKYPFNTPKTKEALHYRDIFEKYYKGESKAIPYQWMPKWCSATDPSARVLQNYSTTDK